MKIKLDDLVKSDGALSVLMQEKLPAKTSFAIARNIRLIEPELINYEDTRTKIIKEQYGVQIVGTEKWQVPPEKMNDYKAAIKPLLDAELDIDLRKIKLDEITVPVAPAVLTLLNWMIDPPGDLV